ncbi:MAG: PilZ domain-containing protein, partial [Polyangiaceae bacterium]
MNEDVRNEEQASDESEQGENQERRGPGARVAFETMVEVGSAAGPSFEAQALDVSEDGMHLKTSFLPEIGQPLTCRFETGPESSVLASGEVVWRQDAGDGGEFGVRFTDLDDESAIALNKIAKITIAAEKPIDQSGTKVRLHIEGLGSPMRAKVKGANRSELTVGSELGFLQVGKELELEDALTGKKRPARIDRVDVEIDPETKIPQLVVALKYEDVEESIACKVDEADAVDGDLESIEAAGSQMKSAFARNAAKVTPALLEMVKKMKIAALAYAEKKMQKDEDAAPKRM